MVMEVNIGSLLDLSTIDWQGNRTFMIFCAGCNFHCPYCQNSSLIPLDSGGPVELAFIKNRVRENIGLLDAIGFTGGEPCLQAAQVTELCEWAKHVGLKTFLNTNGSTPSLIASLSLRGLVDYIAMDVKAPLEADAYGRVIGLRRFGEEIVTAIKETYQAIVDAPSFLEVRTTIVPTLIDDEASVRDIASSVHNCDLYVLQEFLPVPEVPDPELRTVRPPKRERLLSLAQIALEAGVNAVAIRTRRYGFEEVTV
jgi:pyruvate formate lyase activating enzyme